MKMGKEIYELLLAYLREDISEKEMIRLQGWLAENERHRKLMEELRDKEVLRREIGTYASFDTSRCWSQLKEVMDKTSRRSRLSWSIWRSVAAVLVVAAVGGLLYRQITDSFRSGEEQVIVARIEPGRTQAVLITGKGQQLLLQGLKDTCLNLAENETLKINEDGSLKYSLSALLRMPEWHTLRIPKGGEYKIVLDDGTEIWLNSASELRYPAHFVGNERRVYLTGEAYFQVVRDEKRPFIVKTRGLQTRVLGTEFNVQAYLTDKVNVTLVNGQVAVKVPEDSREILLKPNENALYSQGKVRVSKVDVMKFISWKEGCFYYDNERLEDILTELGRWYNFTVIYEDLELKELRFQFWADRKDTFRKVLEHLNEMKKLKIEDQGNCIVVCR